MFYLIMWNCFVVLWRETSYASAHSWECSILSSPLGYARDADMGKMLQLYYEFSHKTGEGREDWHFIYKIRIY